MESKSCRAAEFPSAKSSGLRKMGCGKSKKNYVDHAQLKSYRPFGRKTLDRVNATKLSQRIKPVLQRGRQIPVAIPYNLRRFAPARSLRSIPLFIAGRLDSSERHPLSLAFSLHGQKLSTQQVLLRSSCSHNVPKANIAKARYIRWTMGMKISSGRCEQKFHS
jgi:hypothetical protein